MQRKFDDRKAGSIFRKHELGYKTFPRPKGLPGNFKAKFSDKKCGMKYIDPTNEHHYVRVMSGNGLVALMGKKTTEHTESTERDQIIILRIPSFKTLTLKFINRPIPFGGQWRV